tara:strand:- start:95 stop:211 length:117 start_codon:yes stop_codon:yes gene_type:complete
MLFSIALSIAEIGWVFVTAIIVGGGVAFVLCFFISKSV